MGRNKLRHFKHGHLGLAAKYSPQIIIRVDEGFLLFVLQSVFANIFPQLFDQFAAGSGLLPMTADNLSSGCTGFMKAELTLRLLFVASVVPFIS